MTPGPYVTITAKSDSVLIWSDEHRAWWRSNRRGYTTQHVLAGRYTLEDAILSTRHCGPEKKIRIEDAGSDVDPEKAAFEAWWTSICRQGDPIRRPNLSREAFMAGWQAGNGYAFEGVVDP